MFSVLLGLRVTISFSTIIGGCNDKKNIEITNIFHIIKILYFSPI